VTDDPFAALGLPARAGLSDDDVRAAWRRIAAATHPDRDDGGDAGRFGAAAAAYDTLRTPFGRGEALADLGLAGGAHRDGRRGRQRGAGFGFRFGGGRGRGRGRGLDLGGRGGRLALRGAVAGGVTAAAVLAAGWTPASVGVLVGALTLVFTWVAMAGRP